MRFYFKELNFKDNKSITEEWFEFAKRDLELAKFLINMYPKPLEVNEEDMKSAISSAERIEKFIQNKLQ